MSYYRGYTFVCLCGLHVEGKYAVEGEIRKGEPVPPIDPKRAVCQVARGSAGGQPNSTTGIHYVGCGRTLADLNEELAQRVLERQAAAS